MSTVKVKIDMAAGLVELEGDREFVGAQLEKLLPLIERKRTEPKEPPNEPPPEGMPERINAGEDPIKKKRRAIKRPPAGASCRERVGVLKSEGFFKEQRSVSDIVVGLSKKGWTHKMNQVGASLTPMFEKGEIQRTKEGDSFKYYWDRE